MNFTKMGLLPRPLQERFDIHLDENKAFWRLILKSFSAQDIEVQSWLLYRNPTK